MLLLTPYNFYFIDESSDLNSESGQLNTKKDERKHQMSVISGGTDGNLDDVYLITNGKYSSSKICFTFHLKLH